MRCRRIKFENDAGGNILKRDIVWFGSYGLNQDGTAKFFSTTNKHDNYGTEKVAVQDSLTQRLNVLQGELWYAINEGIPLWGKYKNSSVFDAYIASTILKHPDVKRIIDFASELTQPVNAQYHLYTANVKLATKYGEISITTSQQT